MMTPDTHDGRPLKGRHILAMFVAGFGLIIGVNLTLAYSAVHTFPGVETRSSYVASQSFDVDRAAQEALGWNVVASLTTDRLRLSITGADGQPVAPDVISATLGRATTVVDDITPTFDWDGTALNAPVSVGEGNWNLRIDLRAADGTPFRRRIVLRVTL